MNYNDEKQEQVQNNEDVNLFDLYKRYRNGDKEALSGLFDQKTTYRCVKKHKNIKHIDVAINNEMLLQMTKKAFGIYKSHSKNLSDGSYKKYTKSHFTGELSDMAMIFFEEIQSIFDDKDFTPTGELMLCAEIKRRVTISVNKMLKAQDNSRELYCTKSDNNNNNLDLNWCINQIPEEYLEQHQPRFCDSEISKSKHFTTFISEILELVKSVDLKSLLPQNASFQRNLLDVLYSPDMVRLDEHGKQYMISQKEIAKIYHKRFGYEPTYRQIIYGLDSIYDLLMEYFYSYVPISRCDFEKTVGTFNVHTVISKKANNDLLISAIERFAYDFEKLGYSVDIEKIKEIAINNSISDNGKRYKYWTLKIKNDTAIVNEFYHKFNDCYSIIRNNDTIINGIPDIYHIGNCVVIADSKNKLLYYYNSSLRLRLISRNENDYRGINLNFENIYKNFSKSA